MFLLYQQRFEEAETCFQRLLTLCEDRAEPEPEHIAWALSYLVHLYTNWGRYSDAEALCRRRLALIERTPMAPFSQIMETQASLAFLLSEQGRYQEAEPLYRQVLEFCETERGQDFLIILALTGYAKLLRATGRVDEAEPLEARAAAIRHEANQRRRPGR